MVLLLLIGIGWAIRKIIGPKAANNLWIKWKRPWAYIYLRILKRLQRPIFSYDANSKELDKFGITSPPEAWEKENPRELLDTKHAVDSVNIWGADQSGNVLMLRVARRHGRLAEVWIYLRLESGEEYQAPVQPDLQVCNTDGKSFSVKGLHFEVLEPLRKWRIGFNGVLRKGTKCHWNTDDDMTAAVQFNFIWHPTHYYSAYPLDFNPSLIAKSMAKNTWNREFFQKFRLSSTNWHEQWGQMHGTLTIDQKPFTLLLTGTKTREFGVLNWKDVNKKVVIKAYNSIGLAVDLFAESDKNDNDQINVYHGKVSPPSNSQLFSVSKCDISNAEEFFDLKSKEIEINLIADNRKYNLKLQTGGSGFQFFAGENWDCQGCCKLVKLEINGKEGFGLIETYQKYSSDSPLTRQQSVPQLIEPLDYAPNEFIVRFENKACQNSKLVGGKGASLALMTTLERFNVPHGLCLTKTCFEHHLNENLALELAIYRLQDVAWKKKDGILKEECTRVVELISISDLTEKLKDKLREALKETFGNAFDSKKLAVRSSAIGEDGEDMSAAGQNETFLGVKGFEMICQSVLKCWASQFAFRSVEYKRQNGQLLNGGMGIVIQEMVPADVAGVLFSKDPLTGSWERIYITSNYGLGESVVAAVADPDTIILTRTWNNKLSIAQKKIGKKELKITMSDDGGTIETQIDPLDSDKCTISDAIAIELGKIAIELEKHFGNSRDIEWALQGDKIHLLQARPVTSDSVMTDFEVWHEFDTAMKTSREQYSTANIAEVMPGALSPLSLSSTSYTLRLYYQNMLKMKSKSFRFDPTIVFAMPLYTSHAFMDLVMIEAPNVTHKENNLLHKAMEVAMFGRVMDNLTEPKAMAIERFDKPTLTMQLVMLFMAIPGMINGNRIMKSAEDKYLEYTNPVIGIKAPLEAYQKIGKCLDDIGSTFLTHCCASMCSVIYNGIMLILLSGKSGEFNMDVYSDFASLIGSNNGAESADVPLKLQEIVTTIKEEDSSKTFVSLSPQEAHNYLTSKLAKASVKFREFLMKHGHRGLKEFDVKAVTWGMDPVNVVKMLQTMVKNHATTDTLKKSLTIEESIATLKTPLTSIKKKLVRWLLARSINGVCYREQAKSLLIRVTHGIRLGFRQLAKMLVEDGFISDEELLFFMTYEEIGELIRTRSARIIMRARRRQRQYPYMDSIIYPENIVGLPKPINDLTDDSIIEGATQVTGFPVCHGLVKGIARVVVSLADADALQQNDILITHATDIGWSPYFPMLGGVVTEIGGLISHGAVVAREYGLPCIIDAEHATKILKSGDKILMDATKGIITKINDEADE